ncbi:MAG TPA: type IV toxin-antitoxin system AbiEi family antitoxin domain-containing protein [Phycisphaerae bacterium]|nr:type IV toxin-antitoxin system AbiEi family antitoxin domain-containing protein [Phycisphaerae bacterium]
MGQESNSQKAKAIFRKHGGLLRTRDIIALGVQPRTLYAMRDTGELEQVSRGLYRLADLPPLGNPDLVTVAMRIPQGVICLISALAFHEITTQVPHEVYVALGPKAKKPRIDHPPIRIVWLGDRVLTQGVETHEIDGVSVNIFGPEKTVADCFKFRNKVGLDVAIEALRLCRQRKKASVDKLLHYARICRVEKVMKPYLEAML